MTEGTSTRSFSLLLTWSWLWDELSRPCQAAAAHRYIRGRVSLWLEILVASLVADNSWLTRMLAAWSSGGLALARPASWASCAVVRYSLPVPSCEIPPHELGRPSKSTSTCPRFSKCLNERPCQISCIVEFFRGTPNISRDPVQVQGGWCRLPRKGTGWSQRNN